MQKTQQQNNKQEEIQATIANMDTITKKAVNDTWLKVNENLSGIFSTLLGGADATLEVPSGMEGTENEPPKGLQLRVKLGGEWKTSLQELSGGQKSLLSLSLVLFGVFCSFGFEIRCLIGNV